MKFGTQNKSNKLTENLLLGTGEFDQKLKLWFHWFFNCKYALNFMTLITPTKSTILGF